MSEFEGVTYDVQQGETGLIEVFIDDGGRVTAGLNLTPVEAMELGHALMQAAARGRQ